MIQFIKDHKTNTTIVASVAVQYNIKYNHYKFSY